MSAPSPSKPASGTGTGSSSSSSHKKVRVSSRTVEAIQNECDHELSYPTNVNALGFTLMGSQSVLFQHAHSNSTSGGSSTNHDDNDEEDEYDDEDEHGGSDNVGLMGAMGRLSVKSQGQGPSRDAKEKELVDTLKDFYMQVGSLDDNIFNWEDAKEKLGSILQFPTTKDKRKHPHVNGRHGRLGDDNRERHRNGFFTKKDQMVLGSKRAKTSRTMRRSMGNGMKPSPHKRAPRSGLGKAKTKFHTFQKYLDKLNYRTKVGSRGANMWKQIQIQKSIPPLRLPKRTRTRDENEKLTATEKVALLSHEEKEESGEHEVHVQDIRAQLYKFSIKRTTIAEREARAKERKENERIEKELVEREKKEKEMERQRLEEARKAASSLLRQLTPEEKDVVNEAINGIGPLNEVIANYETDSIQRRSMQQLRPGEWLNDEVIHFFLNMLACRDKQLCEKDGNRKRCHFFKSFFLTKLFDEGATNQYRYSNVKRWSKKVPGKDIFALDKIFFPMNLSNMHWACAVIYMQEKRIQVYDSMLGSGVDQLEGLMQYLKDEWRAKKGGELPNQDEWDLVTCKADTPQQRNGYDCGVFTCMFADFLSMGRPLAFSQQHITQCRERIALSIMRGVAIQ